VNLPRVGHDDLGPVCGEETTDPRAVGAGLQGHGGGGKVLEKFQQGRPGVGEETLANDVAGGIKHADKVALIAQVQAKGETAHGNRSGRSGNSANNSGIV